MNLGHVVLEITESVESFRNMLALSWDFLNQIAKQDETESFIDDWLQSNWERVVEASVDPRLAVVLPPYGEGADCNVSSSRVWKPSAIPNYYVRIKYLGNDDLLNVVDGTVVEGEMILDYFCSIQDGWPALSPPFDHVVLERGEVVAIPVRDLRYFAVRIEGTA